MEQQAQRTKSHAPRMIWRVMMMIVLLTSFAGCKQFILFSYLLGGPPSIEPQFDKQTGKSLTDHGVVVAVVCFADNDLKYNHDSIDAYVEAGIATHLAQHQIVTIDPQRVRSWLRENPDWDRAPEIGAGVTDAEGKHPTHIIYVDLLDYGLYEKDSANLYRGRAEATVSVFEMDPSGNGEGTKIFTEELRSQYPRLTAVGTDSVTYSAFRGNYIRRLTDEIGRFFYEYYNGDDIPAGA